MASDVHGEELRRLPSVDRLLREPALADLVPEIGREATTDVARWALDTARARVLGGDAAPTAAQLVVLALQHAQAVWRPTLVPAINATGVIVHTNLGRAPLSSAALAAVSSIARGYSNLEYDLEAGERGSRHAHVAELLARLTGAEAAMVVNNNAAAVFLALTALAQGREVIISRGQAVEIGGGFRIPDVLRQSGARLVEVGTTNRTYLSDFEAAITSDTALLLRVHSSNFRVVGFVHEVSPAELAALGRARGIAVLDDLGSGALLDSAAFGLAHEPMPQESIAAGSSVVCFSGDKLLGGPQAGLIVGEKGHVERLRRHPLARALRIDKMTLAALQATLLHYARGEAITKVPVWRMIVAAIESLDARLSVWRAGLAEAGVPAALVDTAAAVGGGSLPGQTLPSRALALAETDLATHGLSVAALAARLRAGKPAVVARAEDERLLLDARTVLPEEDEELLSALLAALNGA
ncbi:MAG: L-seryl-tRNA(Sec) selenium transferase [Chloroflexota bacterium]